MPQNNRRDNAVIGTMGTLALFLMLFLAKETLHDAWTAQWITGPQMLVLGYIAVMWLLTRSLMTRHGRHRADA